MATEQTAKRPGRYTDTVTERIEGKRILDDELLSRIWMIERAR